MDYQDNISDAQTRLVNAQAANLEADVKIKQVQLDAARSAAYIALVMGTVTMKTPSIESKLTFWLLGALLTITVLLAGANLATTTARMNRIEANQVALDQRLNVWYGQLAVDLATITGKLNQRHSGR